MMSIAARLHRSTWGDAFRNAWLTLMACAFLKMVLPTTLASALRPALAMAPLLPFMAKDLAHLPDAVARTRAALAARRWRDLPMAWLPPEFVGLLRLDRDLRRGFVKWLLRRPHPLLPAGETFCYLERGSYRTAVAIVLLSSMIELPLDAFIGSLFIADPVKRQVVHGLMIVASLSSLIWVMGDRWWIGAGHHVLDEHGLHVRIGVRTAGVIPRHAIAECIRMQGAPAAWCKEHGIDPRTTLLASPLDKPNVALILVPGAGVRLRHMGRERARLACIFLYLDRPEQLACALHKHGSM